MYVVILAGGGGTRLWPLSTPERPKPFLPLLGEESLFQRTIARLLEGPELGIGRADITVVTDRRHAPLASRQAGSEIRVIEEPEGRNTAAAIALATVAIERPEDEVMVVLPADHTIADEPRFRAVLHDAAAGIAGARGGAFGIDAPLVTLGVQVDRPATEYGYLRPKLDLGAAVGRLTAYPLEAFEEKPSLRRAAELLGTPGVAWNAGMFLWRRRAIRAALRAHAPDILDSIEAGHAAGTLEAVYREVRTTSVDYAVMEDAARAGRVVMGSMSVGWNDLGSWSALLGALGIAGSGRVVQPGEPAEAGPDDLVVTRRDGRLDVATGPARGILDPLGPSALLSGAATDARRVGELIERVAAREAEGS